MSLLSASLTTPNTGQVEEASIIFGSNSQNFPDIWDYTSYYVYSNSKFNSMSGTSNGVTVRLPTDIDYSNDGYSKIINPTGDKLSWYISTNNMIPSPYDKNGNFNKQFYYYGGYGPFSNYKGKENTEIICNSATAQPNWKTDSVLKTNPIGGQSDFYYPAACSCWRFHTAGTNQGDWYLPSIGELGYLCVRHDKINNIIDNIQSIFNITLTKLSDSNTYYISSTEYNLYHIHGVRCRMGLVDYCSKSASHYVRPFTHLVLPIKN